MRNQTLKIFLTWYSRDEYLEVLVGPDSQALEGTVAKVVKKDNATVGITKEGTGVYVRLQSAEKIDRTFKSVAKRIADRDMPTKLQVVAIVEYCRRKINEISSEYAARRVAHRSIQDFKNYKDRDLTVSFR